MTIQYCSDLHLEFRENKQFLKINPLVPKGDILLLGGDIIPFPLMDKHKDFFDFVSDNFQHTYWIPGNHEYYYADISERSGVLNEKIRSNVSLVNNIALEQGNIKLVFSTLWSKINPANEWQIERGMNDFQVIKYKGYRFSVPVYNKLHEEYLAFIKNETSRPHSGKTVVVTHHVPTFLNYPPQYKGSILSEAFAVELFGLIETSDIAYWLYGHHHCNMPDFNIGNTILATNQLGYVKYGENKLFAADKILQLNPYGDLTL